MQQSDIEDLPASNNSYVSNVKDKRFKFHHLTARLLHLVQIKEPLLFIAQISTEKPTDPNEPSTSTTLISQPFFISIGDALPIILDYPICRQFISCLQPPLFTRNAAAYPTSKKNYGSKKYDSKKSFISPS